jgi:hypothetical protein
MRTSIASPSSSSGLTAALFHDCLQVIEVAREGAAPRLAQAASGLGPATDELLIDDDVAFFL